MAPLVEVMTQKHHGTAELKGKAPSIGHGSRPSHTLLLGSVLDPALLDSAAAVETTPVGHDERLPRGDQVSTPAGYVLLIGTDEESARDVASLLEARALSVVTSSEPEGSLAQAASAALVVIDRVEGRLDAVALCARLRMAAGMREVPVLCLAMSNDVEERVRFLEAGADDVMGRPFDALELEARVDALLARSQRPRAAPPAAQGSPAEASGDGPRLVGVMGPKGGSGTTTIAVNTAVSAARRGERRTAIVDLDLQWGDVSTLLNVSPRQSVSDLATDTVGLTDRAAVESYAERHGSGLAVFGAPLRPDEARLVRGEHVGQLLPALRDAYQLTIVDVGSNLDERALTVFEHADLFVVPVVPEIGALRAVRTLLQLLAELEGAAAGVLVVLNHVFARDMLRLEEIEKALGTSVDFELPFDSTVYLAAANAGEPVVIGAPRSAAAERLEALSTLIAGSPQPQAPGRDGRRRFPSLRRRGN